MNGCSLKTSEQLKVVEDIPLDKLHLETGENLRFWKTLNNNIISDAPYCGLKRSSEAWAFVKTKFETVRRPKNWSPTALVQGRNEPCTIRYRRI